MNWPMRTVIRLERACRHQWLRSKEARTRAVCGADGAAQATPDGTSQNRIFKDLLSAVLLLMPRLNHKTVYGQSLPLPVTVDYAVTQITPEEVFVKFSRADAKRSQCFRSGVAVEVGGVVELEDTIRLYISTIACTSQFVWTACYRFQENIVPLTPALETARPRLRACIWSTPVQKA